MKKKGGFNNEVLDSIQGQVETLANLCYVLVENALIDQGIQQ